MPIREPVDTVDWSTGAAERTADKDTTPWEKHEQEIENGTRSDQKTLGPLS